MITYQDKMSAESGIHDLATTLKRNPSFLKYLIRGLDSRLTVAQELQQISEQAFTDPEKVEQVALRLVHGLVEENINDSVRNYSPSELANYFGVSRQTINNWVNANRFTGTARGDERKHVRINETEYFTFPNGEQQQVKEIIANYNAHNKELTKEQEKKEMEQEMEYLDKKYGGNLSTFMEKKIGLLSEDEQADYEEWTFFKDQYKQLDE